MAHLPEKNEMQPRGIVALARACRAAISQARTYLGIARGNSVLPAFMNVVTNDLDALLRWKNRRTPFTESAR